MEKLKDENNQMIEAGTQLVFDDVLLIGTKDYTIVGRPNIKNAKILASLEENPLTEKALIFKKRRRKNSQRHMSSRQTVSMVRIDKIVYEIDEKEIQELQEEAKVLSKRAYSNFYTK